MRFAGWTIARTDAAWCALETSHPPTYYLPLDASSRACCAPSLVWAPRGGRCRQLLRRGRRRPGRRTCRLDVREPEGEAVVLRDHVALYARAMDACLVDGEPVTPQPGGFYGGWITGKVSGPLQRSTRNDGLVSSTPAALPTRTRTQRW